MTTERDKAFAEIDKLFSDYPSVVEISIPRKMCRDRGEKTRVTYLRLSLQTVCVDVVPNSYALGKHYFWGGEEDQDWQTCWPPEWDDDSSVDCPECGSEETRCIADVCAEYTVKVQRCRECGTWFQERWPGDFVILQKETRTDAVQWEYATVRVPVPGQNPEAPDPTELRSDGTGDGATGFEPVARMGIDGWELASTCPIVGTTPAGAVETRSLLFVFKRRRHG